MLLAPGQFLRLNENSSLKMISNKLEDTRLEALSGASILEVVEMQKGCALAVTLGKYTIEIRKPGLYRVDAEPAQLRVYKGEALVVGGGQSITAKEGKEVTLGAILTASKFDANMGDEFARWAERRAGYIATANVSAAREAYNMGSNFDNSGGWFFNSWYGMCTFIPGRRDYSMSPFGFYFFSPSFAYNNGLWSPYGYGYYGNGYYGSGYGYGYTSPGGSATGSGASSGSVLTKQPFPGAAGRGEGNGPRGINRPVFGGSNSAYSGNNGYGGGAFGSHGGGGAGHSYGGYQHGGGSSSGSSNSGSSHVSSGGGSSVSSGSVSHSSPAPSMSTSAPAASSSSSSSSSHVK